MAKNLRFPRVNTVTITGRLTRDIELRYTAGGTPVASLPIAFERVYKDNSGEFQKSSSYMDVVVWSKRAEECAEYLAKGSAVLVEGYLQTRSYETKEGQKRKLTEIVANKVHFLEWNDNDGSSSSKDSNFDSLSNMEPEVTDDDVPF